MPESEEQRQERLAKAKSVKKGSLTPSVSVAKSKASGETTGKRKRGAGRPLKGPGSAKGKRSTEEVVDDMTSNPEDVSEAPTSPWGLYSHFGKVVRKHFPNAQLSKHNGKYLKWGKDLHQKFTPGQIYEIIQILVLDYANIGAARIFFKFAGTPTPTFEQLFSNADTLVTYIGTGIIQPPAARFSPYAEDYDKRHGKGSDAPGKTTDDSVQSLRDMYKQSGQ